LRIFRIQWIDSHACKVNTEMRSQQQQRVSVCHQSALCSQPVAVHSASSPTSQFTVPSHQPVMTRVGRGTPTTSETDCAAVSTSAPWPSVVPRAVSASVRLGQWHALYVKHNGLYVIRSLRPLPTLNKLSSHYAILATMR